MLLLGWNIYMKRTLSTLTWNLIICLWIWRILSDRCARYLTKMYFLVWIRFFYTACCTWLSFNICYEFHRLKINMFKISLLLQIGDLGLSKIKQRTLISGGVRGTIPWMAPELLHSKSNMVTEKVWCLVTFVLVHVHKQM